MKIFANILFFLGIIILASTIGGLWGRAQVWGLVDAFEPTTFAGVIVGGVVFAVGRWLKIQEAQKNMAPHEKGELPQK